MTVSGPQSRAPGLAELVETFGVAVLPSQHVL